jgi:mannosyltransferase
VVARNHGLWYDELYTAEMASVPLGRLVSAIVRGEGTIAYLSDAPPSYNGPYYAVVHGWLAVTRLAADETGLRLLSLVAAVGGMAAFTRTVGRLAGPGVAVVAGLVAATNPFVVQYSAEARGYGLALLATSVAALALARWLAGRPRSLLLYGVAGAAAGLAHWFALLVLGGLALAAVVLRRRGAVPVVAVTAVAALPALGLVLVAVGNGVGASGVWWLSDVGGAVPRLLLRSWAGGRLPLLVVTLVAAGVGLAGIRRRGAGARRDATVVAACWFAVPVTMVTVAEQVRPVFVDRYLLPSVLGLAVLVALGVTRAPRRLVPAALAVVLAASVWATVAETRLGPKEDVRGAVAAVAAVHRAGQPVVAAARWDALGLDHYVRADHRSLMPDMVLPPAAVPESPTVWVVRRAKGGVKGDRGKLEALDADLGRRGLRVTEEQRFAGRYSDTLVQRWEAVPPGAA